MNIKYLTFLFIFGSSFSSYSNEYLVQLNSNFSLNKTLFHGLKVNDVVSTEIGDIAVVDVKNDLALRALKADPRVEIVEPNYTYSIDPIINNDGEDEDIYEGKNLFSQQWGLRNNGTNSGKWWKPGVAGMDINALNAWKMSRGSKRVKIAIIDTGVDYTHPDLKENIWINEAEANGQDGVDDDGNGVVDDIHGYDFANMDADPFDDNGHGTHCAGVIGAIHDELGVAGVMGRVEIMPLKFLTGSGRGSLQGAVKAIQYAIMMNVDIMSNSWGGGPKSMILEKVIKLANEKGILFVAAAGNSNNDNDKNASYPASYKVDNVISVGAMDGRGKRATFSNYGEKSVHVFAPGVDILSTLPNGKYKKLSGTSMATPFVSGVLGLMIARDGRQDVATVKEKLVKSSVEVEDLKKYSLSGGRVDAFNFLQ